MKAFPDPKKETIHNRLWEGLLLCSVPSKTSGIPNRFTYEECIFAGVLQELTRHNLLPWLRNRGAQYLFDRLSRTQWRASFTVRYFRDGAMVSKVTICVPAIKCRLDHIIQQQEEVKHARSLSKSLASARNKELSHAETQRCEP